MAKLSQMSAIQINPSLYNLLQNRDLPLLCINLLFHSGWSITSSLVTGLTEVKSDHADTPPTDLNISFGISVHLLFLLLSNWVIHIICCILILNLHPLNVCHCHCNHLLMLYILLLDVCIAICILQSISVWFL